MSKPFCNMNKISVKKLVSASVVVLFLLTAKKLQSVR